MRTIGGDFPKERSALQVGERLAVAYVISHGDVRSFALRVYKAQESHAR